MWARLMCWLYGHDWEDWHETKLFMDLQRWRTRDCRRCRKHAHEYLDFHTGK